MKPLNSETSHCFLSNLRLLLPVEERTCWKVPFRSTYKLRQVRFSYLPPPIRKSITSPRMTKTDDFNSPVKVPTLRRVGAHVTMTMKSGHGWLIGKAVGGGLLPECIPRNDRHGWWQSAHGFCRVVNDFPSLVERLLHFHKRPQLDTMFPLYDCYPLAGPTRKRQLLVTGPSTCKAPPKKSRREVAVQNWDGRVPSCILDSSSHACKDHCGISMKHYASS